MSDEPLKTEPLTVVLHKAMATPPLPTIHIRIEAELAPGPLPRSFVEDARALLDALLRSLPGGTIDELLILLLQHRAGELIVPYMEAKQK